MTDPADGKPAKPWERFTLLDAFLLQLAFALGLAWGWALTPTEEAWIACLGTAVVFGPVLAAPIVLSVQWLLRGRRALPSVGEQLWIASFACWLTGYSLVMLLWVAAESSAGEPAGLGIALFVCPVFLAQTACSGTALVWLIRRSWQKRAWVPCKWTDLLGSVACLLFGLWLWLPVVAAIVHL